MQINNRSVYRSRVVTIIRIFVCTAKQIDLTYSRWPGARSALRFLMRTLLQLISSAWIIPREQTSFPFDESNRSETSRGDIVYRTSGFAENATLVVVLRNYEWGRCSRNIIVSYFEIILNSLFRKSFDI